MQVNLEISHLIQIKLYFNSIDFITSIIIMKIYAKDFLPNCPINFII
jgi:hypothetical protein